MPHDLASDHQHGSLDATEGATPAPGKRARSERIQREGTPGASAPAGGATAATRWKDPSLTPDVSYVDSLLGAPVQRRGDGPPRSGGQKDERFSAEGDVGQDVRGRILAIAVEEGMSKLTIGLGTDHGVHQGMEGYIPRGQGMLADFQIESARERTSIARVKLTPDTIRAHADVIVNPTSRPKTAEPQHDVETRVTGVRIEGGRTKIMIARGASHGARAGQKGTLTAGAREIADFEIIVAHPTYSEAFVEATISMVHQADRVVLNPSGGGSPG